MAEGVAFAREHNAKVYVAANMVTHEGNQEGAGAFFRELRDIGISAVIVSDPALIEIVRQKHQVYLSIYRHKLQQPTMKH